MMLGWEFPPYISGGLGTACFGLTKALVARGAHVSFVLPRTIDSSHSSHVEVVSPGPEAFQGLDAFRATRPASRARAGSHAAKHRVRVERLTHWLRGLDPASHAQWHEWFTEHSLPGVYDRADSVAGETRHGELAAGLGPGLGCGLGSGLGVGSGPVTPLIREWLVAMGLDGDVGLEARHDHSMEDLASPSAAEPILSGRSEYDGNLFQSAARFARFVVAACAWREFDVIHAHDWLTYPAGIALASVTGKPLVVHVHATEFDRSGESIDHRVHAVERRGAHAAVRVIAVSQLTANLLTNRYGVAPAKVDVVYNGVDFDPTDAGQTRIERHEKIVLYFGRITMQKGPEYFVRAAKRALEVMPNIRFVVAGSGDQAQRMIEMAAAMGIGGRMTFTGFLRGRDIQRVFRMADLYVMPSVSEPFGIAPLEAMVHHVPAIISRSSGVSEVLSNALKVDFWDVDDIANKIVAVLRHPPLRKHLSQQGYFEVRGITWDGAAERCLRSYSQAIASLRVGGVGGRVAKAAARG